MAEKYTKSERVLRLIEGKDIDYLPSHIEFSDRSRHKLISASLGLGSTDDLDDYLENHFYYSFTLNDKPMFYRDVREEVKRLESLEYAKADWDNSILYDIWGTGFKMGYWSLNPTFEPIKNRGTNDVLKFLPERIHPAMLEEDLEKSVEKYVIPDINKKDNFIEWKEDLENLSDAIVVLPTSYVGIFERSYLVMSFQELMLQLALKPKIVEMMFDKVTEYKIGIAKKAVEIGFKVAHCGDDLGTQSGGLFSESNFKKIYLPRLKKFWEVYTDAGIPIMLHSCGNITDYLPYLINAGLKILEPTQPCMDLKYLKKEYGKDLIFFGGIDTQQLPFISESDTRELTRKTIRILGKGGGYIIAPSQELMNDVPIENVKAIVETIREERENVLHL
jgi:uroporphyrinogen decarboxylase